MDSQVERTHSKMVFGGLGRGRWCLVDLVRWLLVEWVVPHLHADKLRGTTGEQDRLCNPGFQCGEIRLQTSDWKHLWGLQWQEKLTSLTGDFTGETHSILEHTPNYPPPWKSAPKGPNLPVGSRGSDWKPAESPVCDIVPSWTPPPHRATTQWCWFPHPR